VALFLYKAICPTFSFTLQLLILLEVFQLGMDCMYALQFMVLILMEIFSLIDVLLYGAESKPAL